MDSSHIWHVGRSKCFTQGSKVGLSQTVIQGDIASATAALRAAGNLDSTISWAKAQIHMIGTNIKRGHIVQID